MKDGVKCVDAEYPRDVQCLDYFYYNFVAYYYLIVTVINFLNWFFLETLIVLIE